MERNQYSRTLAFIFLGLVAAFSVNAQNAGSYNHAQIGNSGWFYKVPPHLLANRDVQIREGRIAHLERAKVLGHVPAGVVIRGTLDPLLLKPALARKFAGALPGVGTALLLLEVAQELGVTGTTGPGGTNSYTIPGSSTEWVIQNWRGINFEPAWSFGSASAACAAAASQLTASEHGLATHSVTSCAEGYNTVQIQRRLNAAPNTVTSTDYSAYSRPRVPVPTPISPVDIAERAIQKTDWGPTSSVAPLIQDILKTEPQSVSPTQVTGPANTPGRVETVTQPDGKVTTNTTTNNYNYGPNSVTVTQTTISSTFDPVTNTTINNGTTTIAPGQPAPEPDKKTSCEENPNALGCAELDTPALETPRVNRDISYSAESMFGGGTCPPNRTMAQALTGQSVVISFQPTCNALTTFVRPIIIAIALLMAYVLILPGGGNRL